MSARETLAEMRAIEQAATEGPWVWEEPSGTECSTAGATTRAGIEGSGEDRAFDSGDGGAGPPNEVAVALACTPAADLHLAAGPHVERVDRLVLSQHGVERGDEQALS